MSVTFPRGFRANGITAGLKASGSADLGLLVAREPFAAAGLFTTNAFAAAPVRLTRSRLAAGTARAVLVNSGQANAATGEAGDRDAETSTAAVAAALGIDPAAVLPCSTGVIGDPLHMHELLAAVPALVGGLSEEGGDAFARAIMTTDTRDKQATAEAGPHRVGGCAKGVGMIAPDLATMLVFVTTDAPVPPEALRGLASAVLEPRFESLTVDASTSTNDTVLLMAGGAAGGARVMPGTREWESLSDAIADVGESLLHQLAADAEGATHVLVVHVEGAASGEDARRVAREIAESPLVKAAAFGGDPNPGRIVQAIGQSGAAFRPQDVHVRIGGSPVVVGGVIPPDYFAAGHEAARVEMKQPGVRISVSLGSGPGSSRALGCDLSYEYVRINGEYTT